ncbi:MAG: thioredoxin family protein [Butyrivibrio sp.]|nr:thioredoxin family protein [Butyrivibrio sp.]
MLLFGFGKKKEENCCDHPGNTKEMNVSGIGNQHNGQVPQNNSENKINSIKVLGSGCKNCHTLFVNTNEALKTMGISCEAEYITDMTVVASYGIMSTPALVVNDQVVAMGKVYHAAEIEKLLHKLGY